MLVLGDWGRKKNYKGDRMTGGKQRGGKIAGETDEYINKLSEEMSEKL